MRKAHKGLVIGCNRNTHHTQWGCPNNNDRAESLFDFILNSNLFLCNRGNVPTFITKICQPIIDLTLVSDSLVGAVKDWAASDEHSFSDHRFVETILSLDMATSCSNYCLTRASRISARADLSPSPQQVEPIMEATRTIQKQITETGTLKKPTETLNTGFNIRTSTVPKGPHPKLGITGAKSQPRTSSPRTLLRLKQGGG